MILARYRSQAFWLALLPVVLLLIVEGARAEDWPMWRHDQQRSAVSGEKLAMPLEPIWTFRSRQVQRAPKLENPTQAKYPWITWYTLPISAAGDSLFFTSASDGRIGCLDAASGKLRWEYLAGCGVNRVPTYHNGKVYAGSHDGYVYCLDAKTGSLVWKFQAAPTERWFLSYARPVSVWPVRTDVSVAADPAIHGGKPVAYFAAGVFPHDGTFLYAIDAETGQELWRNATQAETGWRASMAPAGNLFLAGNSLIVPRDFFGYFSGWGTLITFDRATGAGGAYANTPPLIGSRKDNVHYFGTHAVKFDPPAKQGEPEKQSQLWRHDIPGRWTDIDSVVSIRAKRPVYFRWDPDLSTVAVAGDIVYQTAFDVDPAKGPGSGIYARDANDGKVLWSTDVEGQANQVIVANGRVFAATRQGTIYAFAPKGATAHGVIDEAVEAEPFAADPTLAAAAESILNMSGVKAGYAVVLDCESGALPFELAKRSDLYVLAVFHDADKLAAARKAYNRAGMHVSRIVAYLQKDNTKLPFTSYIADLIASEAAVTGGSLPTDLSELDRLLKPMRGVAIIGGKQAEEPLKKWEDAKNGWQTLTKDNDRWAKKIGPPLAGAGGWTHPFGDAGNTGCSNDAALKGPLGIYWYGEPQLGSPTLGALMIDGVFLLCEDGGDLVARDQYTGRQMWRRPHGMTDTVCGPGSVLLRYLEIVVRLDPATGKELAVFQPPVPNAHWLAMAATADGKTLYLVAGGKDDKKQDWRSMMAVAVDTGNILWSLGGPGQGTRWGGWSAIGDGFIYMLGGAAEGARREESIAEMRAYLSAHDPEGLKQYENTLKERDIRVLVTLDTKTGKVLHEHGVDLTNCGGRFVPGVGYGYGKNFRHYNPRVGSWIMARDNVIVFGTESGADKGWSVWPRGGYLQRSLAVHDGITGKLLWNKPCNYRTRPVIVDETIYAEPWGFDLRTGQKKQRTHPISGESADWAWCRYDKQCGTFSASRNFLFGRSLGVGYHDLHDDNGLYTFFHSRMSCSFDAFSGGGMMVKPPNAVSCVCSWSLPFSIALGHVDTPPAVGQAYAQPGTTLPVKHLYLDVGGNGTRRDQHGNLWVPPSGGGHPLLMGIGTTLTSYDGGGGVQRSSNYTPIENTDIPFVFASAMRGLKTAVIPVTKPGGGKANYTVRLGFAALPGDQAGQRIFDVKLDGETVLKDFDIFKEVGKADSAVWKEFSRAIEGNLTVELVARSEKPSPEQMPVLNAVIVLRK